MDIIAILYEMGMDVWNIIVGTAMTYFSLDPANDTVPGFTDQISLIKDLTGSISSLVTPLVALLFILAIIRECTGVSNDMLPRVVAMSVVKYLIALALVSSPLWVMQNVSSAASGVTGLVSGKTTGDAYKMDSDLIDMEGVKADIDKNIESIPGIAEIITTDTTWGDFFGGAMSVVVAYFIFLVTGVAFIFIAIVCSLSVLNIALHRILKPLIILPFTAIALAAAAGGPEEHRITFSFIKTYVTFILTGAAMLICISFGSGLALMIAEPLKEMGEEFNSIGTVLASSLSMLVTPIMISSLVAGSDRLVTQAFG